MKITINLNELNLENSNFGNDSNLKFQLNNLILFAKNGIHIKKLNRGKFTDYCGGKVTDECILRAKHSSDPKLRKRATFAENARSWKHANGGIFKFQDGGKTPQEKVYERLKEEGYTNNLIAAIMGNIMAESNFKHNAVNTHEKNAGYSGYGVGLIQWSNGRKDKFKKFSGKDIGSSTFDEQLDFLINEMKERNPVQTFFRGNDTSLRDSVDYIIRGYLNGSNNALASVDLMDKTYGNAWANLHANNSKHPLWQGYETSSLNPRLKYAQNALNWINKKYGVPGVSYETIPDSTKQQIKRAADTVTPSYTGDSYSPRSIAVKKGWGWSHVLREAQQYDPELTMDELLSYNNADINTMIHPNQQIKIGGYGITENRPKLLPKPESLTPSLSYSPNLPSTTNQDTNYTHPYLGSVDYQYIPKPIDLGSSTKVNVTGNELNSQIPSVQITPLNIEVNPVYIPRSKWKQRRLIRKQQRASKHFFGGMILPKYAGGAPFVAPGSNYTFNKPTFDNQANAVKLRFDGYYNALKRSGRNTQDSLRLARLLTIRSISESGYTLDDKTHNLGGLLDPTTRRKLKFNSYDDYFDYQIKNSDEKWGANNLNGAWYDSQSLDDLHNRINYPNFKTKDLWTNHNKTSKNKVMIYAPYWENSNYLSNLKGVENRANYYISKLNPNDYI